MARLADSHHDRQRPATPAGLRLTANCLVMPSRRLALLVLLMAGAVTTGLLAWIRAAWLAAPPGADPFLAGVAAAAVILWSASCVIICRWWRRRRSWRLMIAPEGDAFRLTPVPGVQPPGATRRCRPLPGSVVWPGMMALRFAVVPGAGDAPCTRRPKTLLIARDSVSAADYRALSLWLYWLQRRGVPA